MGKRAAAAQREHENSRSQRDDAGPADQVEILAEQERAAGGRHQRRGAARDRIDLPHLARAIRAREPDVIAGMRDH